MRKFLISSLHLCVRLVKKYISNGVVPKLPTSNGLTFLDLPKCVTDLSDLEERMVALYINFMQIRPLKIYSLNPQLRMKGSVVDMPIEINDILQVLPRSFDKMSTIQVKLKRHMLHSSHYLFKTIQPGVVCEALTYLQNTPLYIKYEIKIGENF